MDDSLLNLSDVVREEFGFRKRSKLGNNGLSDVLALDLPEAEGDTDYAPKPRTTSRKKRIYRPKRKHVDVSEQVSDDEVVPDLDTQAYYDGTAPRCDDRGNDLFCICRRGDLGKWMIGCDGCDEWYHGECINVSKADEDLIDQFFCPRCQKNGEGATIWKRKCRLLSCRKPASEESSQAVDDSGDVSMKGAKSQKSKYCTREHGLEYFREKISQALLTKGEIRAMVMVSSNVKDFHVLGEETPMFEGHMMPADIVRLEKLSAEKDHVQADLKRVKARMSCLHSMLERTSRINAALKARKEREICGLDERLNLQKQELDMLIHSDRFFDSLLGSTTDNLCTVIAKKCNRHAGWYEVKLDGYVLEEENLGRELSRIRRDEEEIRSAAQRRLVS